MAGKHRYFEFARYPQYEKLYLMAFDRMLKERRRRERIDGSWGKGATAEEVFHWWMEDDFIPGQMSLEEFLYVCWEFDLDCRKVKIYVWRESTQIQMLPLPGL